MQMSVSILLVLEDTDIGDCAAIPTHSNFLMEWLRYSLNGTPNASKAVLGGGEGIRVVLAAFPSLSIQEVRQSSCKANAPDLGFHLVAYRC